MVTSKKGFASLLKAAGILNSSDREKRTIYSLRHTNATYRLEKGVSVHILSKKMGTSTQMIDQHYGHTVNSTNAKELTKHRDKGDSLPQSMTKPWERIAVP